MSAVTRLIVTIVFGWLGIHKFIDKKIVQGILYFFTFGLFFCGWIIDIIIAVQYCKKKKPDIIENTSSILGIVFSMVVFAMCIYEIKSEAFYTSFFIYILVIGISIFKIFVIDAKKNCWLYSNINIQNQQKNNAAINKKIDFNINEPKIKASFGIPLDKDYNAQRAKIKCQKGKFYEEENIILEKYSKLKTPNYILAQISEQLDTKNDICSTNKGLKVSNELKDKYLDYADFYPLHSYGVQIQDLNDYQLKWYLHWRKEFLNGNILDTDISYIFIFAYELIWYTFNSDAAFNISSLEKLYTSYKELFPKLETYLPEWIDDMLSSVGYFYNLRDTDIVEIKEDLLVNALLTSEELDKIGINIWKTHYKIRKSDLKNIELDLVYGNQKFNNKIKKYAGLLAKYYITNNVDIVAKWFDVKVETEQRMLFNSVPCILQKMEGTFKYKKYFSSNDFDYDMKQITRLCYDLTFPQNGENDYVVKNYLDGQYDLPEKFFYTYFKNEKENSQCDIEENAEKNEFSIDMSVIESLDTKMEYIPNNQDKIDFSSEEKEFLKKFHDGVFSKIEAQQYCMRKGKMLNAYVTELNEKYFSIVHKEIISINGDEIKLNIDWEENA
jgi:TM2 domain-containing membrane protein YozV